MKKYYENASDNAAFVRCIDVMAGMMQKHGMQILKKTDESGNSKVLTEKCRSLDNDIEKAA